MDGQRIRRTVAARDDLAPLPAFRDRMKGEPMADDEREVQFSGVQRMIVPMEVEHAALDKQGRFRITGIMNSFEVTRSRRILHPRGFVNWLKTHRGATLPMLANHGVGVNGFATIGRWDQFDYIEGRGMRWSGWVVKGTKLADDARTLLSQKALTDLSVGWQTVLARWVRRGDAEIDPYIKGAMERADEHEVLAFLNWYPVEGSPVDVGDDLGARLAARTQEGLESQAQLDGVGGPVLAMVGAALQEAKAEFAEQFKSELIELLSSDEVLIDVAAALRHDVEQLRVAGLIPGEVSDDEQLAGLRAKLDSFGKKQDDDSTRDNRR